MLRVLGVSVVTEARRRRSAVRLIGDVYHALISAAAGFGASFQRAIHCSLGIDALHPEIPSQVEG